MKNLFYVKVIFLLFVLSYLLPLFFLLQIDTISKKPAKATSLFNPIFVLNQWQEHYDLRPFVQILDDANQLLSIQDVEDSTFQEKFIPLEERSFEPESHQYYWAKFQIQNNMPEAEKYTEWVLKFSSSWTEMDVFVKLLDGTFQRHQNGTFVPNHLKNFVPTTEGNLIKVLLLPQEVTTIYFRGKSEISTLPPLFWIKLLHADSYYKRLQNQKIKYAIFFGFVMMMFLYNLILFFFERDRSFIFYSLYLLATLIYFSFNSEDLGDWLEHLLFPNHPEYLNFGKLAIYPSLMSYLAFIYSFLDLKDLLPRWSHIFKLLIGLGIPLLMLDFIFLLSSNFSYITADKVTVFYILLCLNGCFLLIYPLYKTRDKKGYFIIAGISIIGLGALLTVIARISSPGFSIFYLFMGIILEIITFSLGLAYRQRENEKAKQQANFELEKAQLIQAQKEIETAQLKELNTFKNQFYTNITHEFRTPLTVIQGLTTHIKTPKYRKETQLIQRNSQKLLQLVNQMLDLSKIESGKMTIQKEQGDVNEYLRYILESFHSLAEQKQIRLIFEPKYQSLQADYDPQKLLDISSNLLSNAIKFTPKHKNIYLKTQQLQHNNQTYWQIEIKDEGIGIEAAELPHIFDRFYQADASATRMVEGTGIGLALVQELVKLLDGEISVESEVGQGTTFKVIFPLTLEAPLLSITAETPFLTQVTEEISTSIHTEDPINKDMPLALLIEDNEDVLHYLVKCLQNEYQIITALNGKEGIRQAIKQVPDIIISDVMMPLADGYEVCSTLKANEKTSHIPIILLTAKADQSSKITGLKSGADAYLSKPFDEKELKIRLEKMLTLRRTLQARYQTVNMTAAPNLRFSKEDAFLQKLKTKIEENINKEDFSIEGLAKLMFMSRTQLFRKVKALTQKSPSLYIRSIRLHQAKHLLMNSSLNISQIAYEVGFKNLTHFSRSFSEEFGQTPSEMRS